MLAWFGRKLDEGREGFNGGLSRAGPAAETSFPLVRELTHIKLQELEPIRD